MKKFASLGACPADACFGAWPATSSRDANSVASVTAVMWMARRQDADMENKIPITIVLHVRRGSRVGANLRRDSIGPENPGGSDEDG
jgi:hypothetical protein